MTSEGWIEFEDTGIPEVGLVARPKLRVVIEGAQGKSRERILDIDTQSDVPIIPQSFAKTIGLLTGKEAVANGERGYLAEATVIINGRRIRSQVFCIEGEESILGVKLLQEFSTVEFDFNERRVVFTDS